MARRFVIAVILAVVVSFYLFPISFTFLPKAVNSKILVAVFGILAFVLDSIRRHGLMLSEYTVVSALIAIVFSIWCLFCVTEAGTYEMDYASYIVSYLTWMTGAYGVYAALRLRYGEVDLALLTRYLAIVCVAQCVVAILIDNYSSVENFVDRFMDQGQNFYKKGHRLYGIGAALDPAGIRFSTVLILLAHQVSSSDRLRNNRPALVSTLVGFAIIMVFGSVISRTTLVGSALGIAYMVFSLVQLRKGAFVTTRMVKLFFRFMIVVTVIILGTIYLYEHNRAFQNYFRFGFEAFFNWIETGEFRTSSTDTLTQTMWVWPTDERTWLIGRGTFGVFENITDIGYCNFTFYCGFIGVIIFSAFFVYCHLILSRKFRNFQICSLLLVALTFIVWFKVTTDIFFIDALLFCIAADEMEEEDVLVGESKMMIS